MFGLSTQLSLKVIERTYDRKIEALRNTAMHAREIEYFKENIRKVNSVDDLMDDFRLYSFVMKAYKLDESIPHRALVKKILSSNLEDRDSLANRVVDSRMKEFAHGMGFLNEGQSNLNTVRHSWREQMIERYLTVQLEQNEGQANPAVEEALYFKRKAPEIKSWYEILADKALSNVFRTAFNLPHVLAGVDIDRQVEIFKTKFDLDSFKDPEAVNKLINRFAAFSDINGSMRGNMQGVRGSTALSMISQPPTFGMNAQIITIDPVTVSNFGKIIRY